MGLPHPLQACGRSACRHAPQRVVAASLPDAQAPKQPQTWARVLLVSRGLQGLRRLGAQAAAHAGGGRASKARPQIARTRKCSTGAARPNRRCPAPEAARRLHAQRVRRPCGVAAPRPRPIAHRAHRAALPSWHCTRSAHTGGRPGGSRRQPQTAAPPPRCTCAEPGAAGAPPAPCSSAARAGALRTACCRSRGICANRAHRPRRSAPARAAACAAAAPRRLSAAPTRGAQAPSRVIPSHIAFHTRARHNSHAGASARAHAPPAGA